MSAVTARDVLSFWFDECEPSDWFSKNDAFDALIIERFSDVHRQAAASELFHWRDSANGRLAEIIILDQFSRNMFRDLPESFAYDSLALSLSQEAIRHKLDQELTQVERQFLYMPFMHSESLAIHDEAIRLFESLGNSTVLDFEKKHRDIIVQFGRYPHRNTALSRSSTQDELAFLKQEGSSF